MKFHDGDEAYSIRFQFGDSAFGDWTQCYIDKVFQAPELKGFVICSAGTAVRYFKDQPNREIARKAALTKALIGFSKEFRKAAWAAYLGRKATKQGVAA